jgi:hypothetical protein
MKLLWGREFMGIHDGYDDGLGQCVTSNGKYLTMFRRTIRLPSSALLDCLAIPGMLENIDGDNILLQNVDNNLLFVTECLNPASTLNEISA